MKTDKADAIYTLTAGRDDHMNFTTTVTRKHARTTSFTEQLRLIVHGVGTGNIDFVLPGSISASATPQIVSREDILRVCRTLNGLGLPQTASTGEAAKELRLAGFSVRTSLVEQAVEYRRAGYDVDMEGEHLSGTPASQLVSQLDDDPDDSNLF